MKQRVGERAGGSPGLKEREQPWGRKKTGRGRDEPAQATARPQECVDQTKAALSGWGDQRGTDKRGPPPAWKPPSSHPSWHGAFPTLTLAAAPSPLSPNLYRIGSTTPSQWRGAGAGGESNGQSTQEACLCVHECVCVRLCNSPPSRSHPLSSAPTLRLP